MITPNMTVTTKIYVFESLNSTFYCQEMGMFIERYVWEEFLDDWMEVGGAPLVKMGASLVKSIEFAHATARLHDYWL